MGTSEQQCDADPFASMEAKGTTSAEALRLPLNLIQTKSDTCMICAALLVQQDVDIHKPYKANLHLCHLRPGTPRGRDRARAPSGVAVLNGLLDGGLPVGAITEFVGVTGSGRTTAALGFAAAT
jgi:hypothetical protein